MDYSSHRISSAQKERLRTQFSRTDEVVPLLSDPKFFSLLVSLGIQQEIGTIHDEFSKFLFDGDSGDKIPRESLRAEMIESNGHYGVRIWAEGHESLDPRVRGLRTLMHPRFSHRRDGRIHQCVFFSETIMQIAAREGVELASVKPWGMNTIFGGFDPSRSYYRGSMWEFVNLDAIRYSRLLERGQIAFWGTHDLVSHIAGAKRSAWPELRELGRSARDLFESYFDGVARPVAQTLVLPYALGMLMDELAQPMNYESPGRRRVVKLLMSAIASRTIDPRSRAYLLKYPPSMAKLFALARSDDSRRPATRKSPATNSSKRRLWRGSRSKPCSARRSRGAERDGRSSR